MNLFVCWEIWNSDRWNTEFWLLKIIWYALLLVSWEDTQLTVAWDSWLAIPLSTVCFKMAPSVLSELEATWVLHSKKKRSHLWWHWGQGSPIGRGSESDGPKKSTEHLVRWTLARFIAYTCVCGSKLATWLVSSSSISPWTISEIPSSSSVGAELSSWKQGVGWVRAHTHTIHCRFVDVLPKQCSSFPVSDMPLISWNVDSGQYYIWLNQSSPHSGCHSGQAVGQGLECHPQSSTIAKE